MTSLPAQHFDNAAVDSMQHLSTVGLEQFTLKAPLMFVFQA